MQEIGVRGARTGAVKRGACRMARTCGLLVIVLASVPRLLAQNVPFSRADANADGALDLSDGVTVLNFLFLGGTQPPCLDALDTDDTGELDISDGIVVFNFLFLGGEPPAAPFRECGLDPTADALGCAAYPFCAPEPPACLGQEDIDTAIDENVPPEICFPADQPLVVGDFSGTICPAGTAQADCAGSGEPGCSAVIMEARGSLETSEPGAERIDLLVQGLVDDLTVRIEGVFGATDCIVDIPFTAVASVPLTVAAQPGGELLLTAIGSLVLDRASTEVSLTASGGLICDLFEAAQDLFIEETITQIEEAADGLLDELRVELVGATLCSP